MIIDIGLQKKDRKLIVDSLSRVLADTLFLYLKTHCYHWNVAGPHFLIFHEMFEKQYQDLLKGADEIAEHMRALGHFVPSSYQEFKEISSIKEEHSVPDAMNMVRQLTLDHETLVRRCHEVLTLAENIKDPVSADLMTKRMGIHTHTAWILRSHLQ